MFYIQKTHLLPKNFSSSHNIVLCYLLIYGLLKRWGFKLAANTKSHVAHIRLNEKTKNANLANWFRASAKFGSETHKVKQPTQIDITLDIIFLFAQSDTFVQSMSLALHNYTTYICSCQISSGSISVYAEI